MERIKYAIDKYPWGGKYRPVSYGTVEKTGEEGVHVMMRTYETEVRKENTEDDSCVYKDSCLEFFVNFYPSQGEHYINFEVNANGAMLSAIGPGRKQRTFLKDLDVKHPVVTVTNGPDYWEIDYVIGAELIQKLYGRCDLPDGHIIIGNFYKCGDMTKEPHYGCWAVIDAEKPDFHRPECFGKIKL